jgi:hypothetical protein
MQEGKHREFTVPHENHKNIAQKSAVTKNDENAPKEETPTDPFNKPKSNNQLSAIKDDPIVTYTRWLMYFTGLLAFFNSLLWLFTAFLWRSTKKAADAATLNANAFIGMERPYLRLYHLDFGDMGAAGLPAKLQYPKIDISIRNYGRTPAFLVEKAVEFLFQESLPNTPIYQQITLLPPSEIIQPDQIYNLVERPLDIDFWSHRGINSNSTMSDWQSFMRKLLEERKRFWIYGYITYKDFLDIRHRLCFCKQFILQNVSSESYSFKECDNPNYNETY